MSYQRVTEILDAAVGGPAAPVGGPHGPFWRNRTRDEFVALSIFGLQLVTVGDGAGSTLVRALRGEAPFGQDIGTPGGQFRRMPAGRPPVPEEQIAEIAQWVDDGCPEEEAPAIALEVALNGAASGTGFVIVSTPGRTFPATLTLRTTDGSQSQVTVQVSEGSTASLLLSPTSVDVSGSPAEVTVVANTPSGAQNDTAIHVLRDTDVVARFELTAIEDPMVRFAGRFQCRLPTDPDPFDDPWGQQSSFGVYAVQGPDPDNPDEPPLDRIVRFQDPVALRPFCAPVGVAAVAVEAEVGGTVVRFASGDPLIGEPVRLGPDCTFDSRNRTFAPDGFEPISDFRLQLGGVFSGASAPAVPRSSPQEPPGSTAPYADGIFQLDVDATPWSPADFGYREATWAERSWAVVARKLARLVTQVPADERAARIRDRRLKEHAVERLGAIRFPIQLMERYRGLIDRELVFADNPQGVLAYLASLPAVEFYAEFFDFDTDCQTGTVTGTLGAPKPAPPPSPPQQVLMRTPLRRMAPQDQ